MITLDVGGTQVQVEDSFAKLDPAQQNATVSEIVKSLGIKASPEQPENSLAGSAKAIGSGLAEGVASIAGLPADALDLAARGIDYAAGTDTVQKGLSGLTGALGSEAAKHGIESITGELPKPQTNTEKYLHNIAAFAPAAIAGPGGIARRAITQAVIPGIASEAAGQLAEGTGYEPVARVAGALTGAVGASKIADALSAGRGATAVPTASQIKKETSDLYNGPAQKALEINPAYADKVAGAIEKNLQREKFSAKDPDINKVYTLVDDMRKPEFGTNHTLADFDNTRRRLNEIKSSGGSAGEAANRAIRTIDAATLRVPQSMVAAGDARAAAQELFQARKSAAVGFRSELVQKFVSDAMIDAQSTHSGGNLENVIYQKIRNALKNPGRDLRGWTAQEKQALRDVLPGHGRGALRRGAKLLGGGGGLGQLASGAAGSAMFGPLGAIGFPMLGLGLNKIGSSIAMNKLQGVDELLRSRAPSYAPHLAARQAALSGTSLSQLQQPALLQALIASQQPQYVGR